MRTVPILRSYIQAKFLKYALHMKFRKITSSGQISLPAGVRKRWGTNAVAVEDMGDHVLVRPLPDDPIAAARGALKGKLSATEALRKRARKDESAAEARR